MRATSVVLGFVFGVWGCAHPSEPVVAASASAANAREVSSSSQAHAGSIHWETSEPHARERARTEGSPLLIYLWAEWATASLWMDRQVWSDRRIVEMGSRFVAVRVDLSRADGRVEAYAQAYGVRGLPATLVVDPTGEKVTAFSGIVTADTLLQAMKEAALVR